MQSFATVKSSPWAIAWLIDEDDWPHFEQVIHYNCTILGGCFNVVIPVSKDGQVWKRFELFLAPYDADFIVLAPEMKELPREMTHLPLNAYAIVDWDRVSQIIPANNMGWTTGQAAQVGSHGRDFWQDKSGHDLVAVSDHDLPDTSLLALIARGDVLPAELEPEFYGGSVYFHAHGYRESTLGRVSIDGRRAEVSARSGDNDSLIPAPSRYELASLIRDENRFPLVGAAKILEACCSLQHLSTGRLSFIGRTATVQGTGTPSRRWSHLVQIPGLASLVSDEFGFHEAVLVWNLRANQVVASWLSFTQLTQELYAIREWLDSDFGATFYSYGDDVAFATTKAEQGRLNQIFTKLTAERGGTFPEWKTSSYDALTVYELRISHQISVLFPEQK